MRWLFLFLIYGAIGGIGPATPEELSNAVDPAGRRFRCDDLAQDRLCLSVLDSNCELKIVSIREEIGSRGKAVLIPPEVDDAVEISCANQRWYVRSSEDLHGQVEIQSPADAIEYLRFFSTFTMVHHFDDRSLEIFVGPDDECFSSCLPKARWEELALQPTKAGVADEGYVVSRNVVLPVPSDTNVTAYRVIERVSPEGEVSVEIGDEIPLSLLDKAHLSFPGYL